MISDKISFILSLKIKNTVPNILSSPNSGLVVQYSPFYGVTADGTGSEEFGTTPDIPSSSDELPLNTCLKEIKKSEQKNN